MPHHAEQQLQGVLGTIVSDLERASSKKIQIEVPAKLVELLSRADVELNADVETLQIDKDAAGAQLEIKRGTMVGGLTADAKVELTGSGTVASLMVSVNGVTVSGSLNVKKTDAEGGAKAPTVSGGSSGSSGNSGDSGSQTLKEITGVALITAKVPYGTESADALAAIPKTITLNLKDGSTVQAAAAGWKWADGVTYSGTTAGNYTAEGTFTVPVGHAYGGTMTATATVTVKALDTSSFEAALAAAQSLQKNLTTDETQAATDPTNKVLITNETNAAIITKGVRFTTSDAQTALTNAVTAARMAQTKGFASQQACNEQTEALTGAAAAFNKTIKTGENATTNAYVLNAVKKWLNDNREQANNYAYDSTNQPLRQEKAYELPASADLENNLSVKFEWSKNDDTYLEMTQNNSGGNYSLTVKSIPPKPQKVTFTAKVMYNNAEIGTIDYTATVGAPISMTAPTVPPRFVSQLGTSTVPIYLNGAAAIKSVPETWGNQIATINGNLDTDAWYSVSISSANINSAKKRGEDNGLDLTVTITTGTVSGKWMPNNDPPAYNVGKLLNISIDTSGFTLKTREEGNLGWYLPDKLRLDSIDVWVLTPVFTNVQTDAMEDSSQVKVTITTQYMPKNPNIHIALAPSTVEPKDIDTSAFTKSASLVDGETDKYEAVFDRPTGGTTYKIWCQLGLGGDWHDTSTSTTPRGGNTP